MTLRSFLQLAIVHTTITIFDGNNSQIESGSVCLLLKSPVTRPFLDCDIRYFCLGFIDISVVLD